MGGRTETRRLPHVWGATDQEVGAGYPCDAVVADPHDSWFRAVTVHADRSLVFRWMCQLKVAPYSYDLLDNLGRRSPRTLTPGVGQLRAGQRVMTIFELVDFEPDRHLTCVLRSRRGQSLFGEIAITYSVTDTGPGATRLVAKLIVGPSGGLLSRARAALLPWGDLVMMHRQLHTLRKLAEEDSARDLPGQPH